MTAGVEAFTAALSTAGCEVEVRGPIVLVRVDVPSGNYAGSEIMVGADPPQDFPTIPPHWVHLPDSVDLAQGGKQASELGQGWAKWSRPHKRWADGAPPASQWLAHVRALLATAA